MNLRLLTMTALLGCGCALASAAEPPAWIAASNAQANKLLEIQAKYEIGRAHV